MSSDSEWDAIQDYASPICREGFSCHGADFYVQASHFRIRRADPAHLHSLLTYTPPPPLLTKAGKVAKRQPRPHEDESEEFYIAQVAHYGMQPVKTKEGAKQALLAAFGSKTTLEVPARIFKLRESMRKEYSEANKVAKAKYMEEKRQEKDFLQEKGGERPLKKGKAQLAKENKELSGKFKVVAPFLTEQWEDQTRDMMWLELYPSSTTSHLWGAFDFGVVSGVIRSTSPLPTHVGESVAFLWRGRESGEGETTFGDGNVGSIVFLGAGKLKAKMDWDLGNFDFAGIRLEGAKGKVSPKSVREWKSTWRGINPRAYERENRARWGAWGGDDDDGEQPAGSDTTEGRESEGEGEEGYGSENYAF
ncbi:hypothetical protein DFH09DRAFT_1377362 [Mycena vulgaris]|nr:hypothetical protein DFH09DRAFT_1377362 [Mycena vulgaris]